MRITAKRGPLLTGITPSARVEKLRTPANTCIQVVPRIAHRTLLALMLAILLACNSAVANAEVDDSSILQSSVNDPVFSPEPALRPPPQGSKGSTSHVWVNSGYRVYWSDGNPLLAYVELDKNRSDDMSDGYTTSCVVFGLMPVPVLGGALAAACASMTYLAKTGRRIAGYCLSYQVLAVDPIHPKMDYYTGGFCT